MELGPEETLGYLSVLRALRSSCRFYDMHVHPYEVLFDKFAYDAQSADPGVLSLPGGSYSAPSINRFRFPEVTEVDDSPRSQRLQDISVMLLRKVYGSVGARVFLDHMDLSGMDKVLLLPVASDSGDAAQFDIRMQWIERHYPDRDRFWIAGSSPAALGGEEIGAHVASLKKRYGVKAMKCHPVVSGIDMGMDQRKQWLEMLLAACRASKLPLVLHGGRHNPYWGGSRGDFGSLEHLREINFSLSEEPVVLAHAGVHRCSVREMEQQALPLLKTMLKTHPNLHVDISGLGFEPLKLVLQSVDTERILFGSDALYVQQWEAVTMTMHALKELGMNVEESFVRLAGTNPGKTIFKDEKPC